MIDLSKFSERLKKERQNKNLTFTQLSKLTGVDRQYLSSYETGKHMPSMGSLINLAEALNVPVGYLLGGNYYD